MSCTSIADTVLDLSIVDFSNVDEINSFAYSLINAGNSIGLYMSATPLQSREAMQIYQAAKGWVSTVKRQLLVIIMFRVIRNAVRQRNKAFFDKPLTWSCISEERWHKEAILGFDNTRLSDYDIISRVTILLESDLYAYEVRNQNQFKKSLAERCRHYLNDYTSPDRRMVATVKTFAIVSSRFN